jgi:hypothetical protein
MEDQAESRRPSLGFAPDISKQLALRHGEHC